MSKAAWFSSHQVTDLTTTTRTNTNTPNEKPFLSVEVNHAHNTADHVISSAGSKPPITERNDDDDISFLPEVTTNVSLLTPDITHATIDVDDVPPDVFDFMLSVCPISCETHCSDHLRPRRDGGCFCAKECELYGDCCFDYYLYCKEPVSVNDTSHTVEEFEQLTTREKERLTVRVHMTNYYKWSLNNNNNNNDTFV